MNEFRVRIGDAFDTLKNVEITASAGVEGTANTSENESECKGETSGELGADDEDTGVSVLERVFQEARGVHSRVRAERAAWRVHPRESVATCRTDTTVFGLDEHGGEHATAREHGVLVDEGCSGDDEDGERELGSDTPGYVERVASVIVENLGESVSRVWARLIAYESWFAYCLASQRCAGVRKGDELACDGVGRIGEREPGRVEGDSVTVDEYVLVERERAR